MVPTPEPEPIEGDSMPRSPSIRMIWLFLIFLSIAVLMGIVVVGLSVNDPPRIVGFTPMYGSIGPGHTNEVIVYTEDEGLPNNLQYKWEVSEGIFWPAEKPYVITYHAPNAGGEYYVFVTVTVTDLWGKSAAATTRILVTDAGMYWKAPHYP